MRTLKLTSPHMKGGDVKRLQGHVNVRLRKWGAHHNLLREDGEFGPRTAHLAKSVGWGLGMTDAALDHGITSYVQARIADPGKLNAKQRRLAAGRKSWRGRLAKRLNGSALDQVLAYAHSMVGVHERPPGSNLGPHITTWIHLTGYPTPPGVYWCGCFINGCMIAGGFHPQHFLGYVPSIEAHAKAGLDGWRWHGPDATPQAGWIACFGQPIGEHTELVVHTGHPLRTIGGNTSKGDGSPNNGGVVAAHDFSHYRGLPLRGFAAPVYH
jgi:hypothetical protein